MFNAFTYLIVALLTTAITGQLQPAYCTYHMYEPKTATSGLSCSDGANGVIGWGYNDLSAMFPYVTAWQSVSWNSPNCGTCIRVVYNDKSIHITAVDQCGPSPVSGSQHFDISHDAFVELFGDEGISKGTMNAQFQVVDSSICKANKKPASKQTTSKPPTTAPTTAAPPVVTPPVVTPKAAASTVNSPVVSPPVVPPPTTTPTMTPHPVATPPVVTPNVTSSPPVAPNVTAHPVNSPIVSPPVVIPSTTTPKATTNVTVKPTVSPPVHSDSSPQSSESITVIPYPPTSVRNDKFQGYNFSFSEPIPTIRSVLNRFRSVF